MARPAGRERSLYFEARCFPYRPPAALREERRVVVVGGGPVGLTAALALARHGVPVVVLDDKRTVSDGSRAICIARHSVESLQQLGLAERVVAKALGWTAGTSYYRQRAVFRLSMPHSDDERFLPMYNLQQQYLELFLAEAAQADPRIELRWGHRLAGLRSASDHVALDVATPDGSYRVHADYVLAADGARSQVRRSLDLALRGAAYEGRYVIVDIRLPSEHPTERRAFFDPPANPGATVLVHKQPDDIWRIDYQLAADQDETQALAESSIRNRVAAIVAMLGERAPWELEWWSLYQAYTVCLDDYRAGHGRVLFMGDAAHLVPIFGVRGLNSGIADAMNAAWKLAYVLRGAAPPTLLDSYSPERRGATLEIFAQAGKSTRFMTPPTRGYRRVRDAALALAAAHPFAARLLDPRQAEPYTYRDSALTSVSDDEQRFDAGPDAGAPLANRRLDDGRHLLDLLGAGFTALYFSADGQVPDEFVRACATLDRRGDGLRLLVVTPTPVAAGAASPIVDRTGALATAHGARAGGVYLVRPDRHICARWQTCSAIALTTAFERALGNDV